MSTAWRDNDPARITTQGLSISCLRSAVCMCKKSYDLAKQPTLASTQLLRACTTWLGGVWSLYVYTKISMASTN